MKDDLTEEERRLIDEAVSSGHVRRFPPWATSNWYESFWKKGRTTWESVQVIPKEKA